MTILIQHYKWRQNNTRGMWSQKRMGSERGCGHRKGVWSQKRGVVSKEEVWFQKRGCGLKRGVWFQKGGGQRGGGVVTEEWGGKRGYPMKSANKINNSYCKSLIISVLLNLAILAI